MQPFKDLLQAHPLIYLKGALHKSVNHLAIILLWTLYNTKRKQLTYQIVWHPPFTREQRMEHHGTANAISHFNGTTDHALCVGEIATQQQQQKLSVKYHSHSRKHPKRYGRRDIHIAIPSSRDQGMSFDVQNKNWLWEIAYIKAHCGYKLPHPIKAIFSIQRNGNHKVTFVPFDGENNIFMKGFQHPRPGKCFKMLKSVYNNKQAKTRRKIEKVLYTDTVDGRQAANIVTSTPTHTYNLHPRLNTTWCPLKEMNFFPPSQMSCSVISH